MNLRPENKRVHKGGVGEAAGIGGEGGGRSQGACALGREEQRRGQRRGEVGMGRVGVQPQEEQSRKGVCTMPTSGCWPQGALSRASPRQP